MKKMYLPYELTIIYVRQFNIFYPQFLTVKYTPVFFQVVCKYLPKNLISEFGRNHIKSTIENVNFT